MGLAWFRVSVVRLHRRLRAEIEGCELKGRNSVSKAAEALSTAKTEEPEACAHPANRT